MDITNLKIKLYSDGADINDIKKIMGTNYISGITTNPSLLKKAGVDNYKKFAERLVSLYPDVDISFEIFSDDLDEMEEQASLLQSMGKNVHVKIPIITTSGKSTRNIIKKLSEKGINVNVTAVTTIEEVDDALSSFSDRTNNIISLFIGRLNDKFINTKSLIEQSIQHSKKYQNVQMLWASTREVYDIKKAEIAGFDIITVPPTMLEKLELPDKTAKQISIDTVKGFQKDIKLSGLTI